MLLVGQMEGHPVCNKCDCSKFLPMWAEKNLPQNAILTIFTVRRYASAVYAVIVCVSICVPAFYAYRHKKTPIGSHCQ